MTSEILIELRDQIKNLFDIEELQELCFDLNIPFQDIPGTTLGSKVVALISYCERRGITGKLLAKCKVLRPTATWPTYRIQQSNTIDDIRSRAKTAYETKNYLALIHCLGEAESLVEISGDGTSTNELLAEICYFRAHLREELGRASTLLVTGGSKQVYQSVRKLLDSGTFAIIDEAGLFGNAGKLVDISTVLQWARAAYLNQVIQLCRERVERADSIKQNSPVLALKILEEAKDMLSDEIFGKDDQALLETTSQLVDYKIAETQRLPKL